MSALGGATVTYVALQLAFHMGFQAGRPHRSGYHFATQGQANKTVVSDGADPNHFSPSYFAGLPMAIAGS